MANLAVLELAQQLIACPSITPQDAGCQAIIAPRLLHAGFQCESMRFGDVDNLWARYGKQSPLFVFAGHTDVVPTGSELAWTSPPFQPTVRDGYLYGRGATDMKSGLAAMIVAAENFIAQHKSFPGSIGFLITSDEEGPALHGTKQVLETLLQRQEYINYCIVGEASSEIQLGDQVRIGRRGSLHGKLIIRGKQGHVAYPHLALNPVHHSLAALHQLTQETWDQGNQAFPATTFQITHIHAGTGALNVIPGALEVCFNFRFSTAVTAKQLQERVAAILRQSNIDFEIQWEIGGHPFLSRQGKLFHATQRAIQEITGLHTKPSTGGGTSDGRFIAPTGAEVLELGPCHSSAHQVDEGVRIKDLEMLSACYQRILELLFK
ncbi:MAG: succinyl-diaminopimelate desuccinylase [Gammaproteobacteria bacterium RIFCSPHIGHO2_12_FULL_41_20]|nr:MAG: succinyl-diaminopimelate desuccinylase [Gammaproteobacteria bacterium RIFCSPHIGHO2_12_FULL_41_20]